MSNKIYELREKLMRELEMLSDEKALTPEKLNHIDTLAHAIKCIDTVCAMEERGYSRDDRYYGNSYRPNRSYNSYADGRMPTLDRMYYDNSYGYSQHDPHSDMMYRLEDMLKMAQTEKEREAIRACMNKLNS